MKSIYYSHLLELLYLITFTLPDELSKHEDLDPHLEHTYYSYTYREFINTNSTLYTDYMSEIVSMELLPGLQYSLEDFQNAAQLYADMLKVEDNKIFIIQEDKGKFEKAVRDLAYKERKLKLSKGSISSNEKSMIEMDALSAYDSILNSDFYDPLDRYKFISKLMQYIAFDKFMISEYLRNKLFRLISDIHQMQIDRHFTPKYFLVYIPKKDLVEIVDYDENSNPLIYIYVNDKEIVELLFKLIVFEIPPRHFGYHDPVQLIYGEKKAISISINMKILSRLLKSRNKFQTRGSKRTFLNSEIITTNIHGEVLIQGKDVYSKSTKVNPDTLTFKVFMEFENLLKKAEKKEVLTIEIAKKVNTKDPQSLSKEIKKILKLSNSTYKLTTSKKYTQFTLKMG